MKTNPNQVVILKDLFEYLFSDTTQSEKLRKIDEKRRAHIKKKIEENFINPNTVSRTFTANLATINLIERFVKDQFKIDDQPVLNLVDRIQSIYMSVKKSDDINVAVEKPLVFDDITNEILNIHNLPSDRFFSSTKSVILYFFEMCDIGKIPDSNGIDKPKPFSHNTLFDEQDDE